MGRAEEREVSLSLSPLCFIATRLSLLFVYRALSPLSSSLSEPEAAVLSPFLFKPGRGVFISVAQGTKKVDLFRALQQKRNISLT